MGGMCVGSRAALWEAVTGQTVLPAYGTLLLRGTRSGS